MSDTERIERLEAIVRALHQQLGDLRAEVAALRGTPLAPHSPLPLEVPAARPPTPPSGSSARAAPVAPAPRAGAVGSALDLEALIGRYGTIALATLAILMGAGAFLTWAIAHGLLGPVQRVILGALGAAAVAALGQWLRARGTARFGNIMLALALALVHLDAWAAGPRLHLIAPEVALAVAATASIALAALALRAAEEPLFCVGLGGALLAPFVVSSGGGNVFVLAGYGWILIAAGTVALRTLGWRVALALIGAACALYAGTGYGLAHASASWIERHVPTVFALACAWAALAWGVREVRGRLALAFLGTALAVQLPTDWGSDRLAVAIPAALAGTLTAYGALRAGVTSREWRLAGAVLLPLGFFAAGVTALHTPGSASGALIAAGWTVLAFAAAWPTDPDGELHLATAATASGTGLLLELHGAPERCIIALAVHAALFAMLLRRRRAQALAVPIAVGLAIASLWAFVQLDARAMYHYAPFLTLPSLAALACVAGWWVASSELRRAGSALAHGFAPLPALAAFVWARQELVGAFAPDVATFLLIIYYALAGVGFILHGRRRARPRARAVGLALAFYAGIKALVQAWDISAIGLRVASCLLAGLFIALVAYWYRAPEKGGPRGAGVSGQGATL